MRTAFVKLTSTAIAIGITTGLAQNLEEVKPVFEHLIPNAHGKSMVAVVVSYPFDSVSAPRNGRRDRRLSSYGGSRECFY